MKLSKLTPGYLITRFFLLGFAVIFFLPLVWMVSTSLKDKIEIAQTALKFIPDKIEWKNYSNVFARMPVITYFKNTLFLSVVPTALFVTSSSLVAYSLSKIPWTGAKILFPVVLAVMMMPSQVTLIPMYTTWSKLGFVNTFVPLVLPAAFGSPYYIFLMRQFFKGVPDSYMEAARIDGAGEFRIYSRLMLPLSKPVLTTAAIFTFIAQWNDFINPLYYLQKPARFTLAIGLQMFKRDAYTEWGLLMAASVIFTFPLIILFFIGQKQFIKGIVMTGFK